MNLGQLRHIATAHRFLLVYIVFLAVMPFVFSSAATYYITIHSTEISEYTSLQLALVFLVSVFTITFALTPTTFVCFAAGFLWGWVSLAYIVPAYMLAQWLGYTVARFIDGEKLLGTLTAMGKMQWLQNISGNQFKLVFFCRLSPVLPFALMNVVLGVLHVNKRTFLSAGLLGMLPRTLCVLWLGTRAQDILNSSDGHPFYKILLVVLVVVSLFGIGKIIFSSKA